MRDIGADPGRRFATLIKEGRERLGWTQEDLVAESGVSRQTIIRYESGKASNPKPGEVRAVCEALHVDPREAVVALGYVTREELGLPPAEPPIDPALARVARSLAEPRLTDQEKDMLRRSIKAAYEVWLGMARLRAPKEPSAAERAGRRSARSTSRPE